MRSALSATLLGLSALLATATPVPAPAASASANGVFPNDGFPNPSDAQVKGIQQTAFGTLPNGPPPAKLSHDGEVNLQLIALNEIFEVAFFNSLLHNVTTKAKNYEVKDYDFTVKTLKAIVAQEELHALNANGALKHFGCQPIQPCTDYIFGTTSFKDAINLAGTFTSVVLGVLQDITEVFAENGDTGLTRAVASVIGNEAEQEGWFRLLQGQIPNELPFLTTAVRDFAFTALQGFAAPGSCPSVKDIPLKTFQPLNVVSPPGPNTAPVKFQIPSKGYSKGKQMYITYINQQNTPIVEKASYVSTSGGMVTLSANFPYEANEMNGLTIASLSDNAGPYASADDVAAKALNGPGLIIVQPKA